MDAIDYETTESITAIIRRMVDTLDKMDKAIADAKAVVESMNPHADEHGLDEQKAARGN